MSVILTLNFVILQLFINLKQQNNEDPKKDLSALLLKEDNEEIEETDGFKCPLVPFLPCLGIYCNFILCLMGVGSFEWIIFIIFELIGCSFYFIYGYKNSNLQYKIFKHNLNKKDSYIL